VDCAPQGQACWFFKKSGIEVAGEWVENPEPGLKALLKRKSDPRRQTGGPPWFDVKPVDGFETFPSHTGLLADAQLFNELFVSLRVASLQVLQQPLPPAHHIQQTTPRGVVFTMNPKVLSQVIDPSTEQRNLHFR
jgi:hypothetical protein